MTRSIRIENFLGSLEMSVFFLIFHSVNCNEQWALTQFESLLLETERYQFLKKGVRYYATSLYN